MPKKSFNLTIYRKIKMKFHLILPLLLIATTNTYAAYENFSADNSAFEKAQYVGDLFDASDIHIFGGRGNVPGFFGFSDNDEADFYSFIADANTILNITVLTPFGPDNETDPILGLFNSQTELLAIDDDSHFGFGLDSFLSYSVTETDLYTIAISAYDDYNFDGIGDFGAIDTDFLYTVDITSVPIPTSVWLFGSALISLVGLSRGKSNLLL